jgi:hypothetical protein
MDHYFQKKFVHEDVVLVRSKVTELLKFLLLLHHAEGDIPVSQEVDEVWHLWIMQTKQYQELCEKLPSQKFIHHCSNDYPSETEDISDDLKSDSALSYLVSYVNNFEPFTEESVIYWPTAAKLLSTV